MIDLRPDHLEIVRDLLRQHVPECEVRAFGSRFKWTAKQASDLDLAVVGTKRLPTKKIMRLKEAFEESILPMRVDVLDWHAITPEFQRVIDAGFEVIQGGEVSPLATASSPSAAGSSATPLSGENPRNVPDWEPTTLGNICNKQGGAIQTGPFGSQLHASDYVKSGIPVVMPVNIGTDGRLHEEGIERISVEDAARLSQHILKAGDIVFSRRGDVTRCAYVEEEQSGWFCGTGCLKIKIGDEKKATSRFIALCLKLPESKEWLIRHAVGATMPNLNTSILSNVPLKIPPLSIQKSIASILGALEDRIELCRRTNETLESTARALFKDWFIDFGPVRAKLEGRDPYLAADVWSLFPDRLVDSELGEIPEGWNSTTWGSIITLEYGKSLRDYRENNGIYRVYGTNGPIGFCDQALCETSGIVIGRKGAYRGVHYSPEPFFVIDTAFYLKPKAPMSILWAYYEIKRFDINGMDSGSAIPSTSRPDFYGISVVEPSPDIQKAFESAVGELYKRIAENNQNIDSYSNLRDSLLPKLLSGELSIPDAQLMVEETP